MSTPNEGELRKPQFIKCKDIEPSLNSVYTRVKVVEHEVIVNETRGDGSTIRVAEALVGDETGCVILTCRNENVDLLAPGKVLNILNGRIEMFDKTYIRLVVNKWGKIQPSDEPIGEVNRSNNVSLVAYKQIEITGDEVNESK